MSKSLTILSRYVVLVLTGVLVLFSFQINAQRRGLTKDPALMGDTLVAILQNTGKETAIETADEFAGIYSSLGISVQQQVVEQVHLMLEKKYSFYPMLHEYVRAITSCKSDFGGDNELLAEYLDMTARVIDEKSGKYALDYFKTMAAFFHNRTLHNSDYYKLYAFSDEVEFEYVSNEPVQADYDDSNIDPYVEDYQDPYAQEENYADTIDWDAYFDNPANFYNPSGGAENNADPAIIVEEELVEFMKPTVQLPVEEGPVVRFKGLNLVFSTFHDSLVVENTSGFFKLDDKTFTGSKGRTDWRTAGLDPGAVSVDMNDYTFKTGFPEFKAVDVKLRYDEYLDEPIEGVFSFKSVRHDTIVAPTYPKFISFTGEHIVKNLLPEEVFYEGGFSISGLRVGGSNMARQEGHMEIQGLPGNRIVVESRVWDFADSLMFSPHAAVWILHKRDTLKHPSVEFQYFYGSKTIRLGKEKGRYKDTPYISTFYNMKILPEEIVWDMKTDSLDMVVKSGKKWVPVVFESIDHFEKWDYQRLNYHYGYHPLAILYLHYKRTGQKLFYLTDVAFHTKKDIDILSGSTKMLANKGLLDFDPKTRLVRLFPSTIKLVEADMGKVDYDDIILESVMEEHPEQPNATMFLTDDKIIVRGVEYFKMSDSMNVEIRPDSSTITLLKNRGIQFDGKISAGDFEYTGRDFLFKYDSFLVNMGVVDEMKMYVTDSLGNRKLLDNSMKSLDSAAAAVAGVEMGGDIAAGTLYINDPENKSALKKYPQYPNYNTGMGGVFYFDRPEILNGVYDKSIFFVAPPFDMDMGETDTLRREFEGKFASSGMFPVFEETLKTQPDNSMGFYHQVPDAGYQLYEGSGKLYGDISLDKKGIKSTGQIDFLSTTLKSQNFTFYPDSVTGMGIEAEIREEEHGGVIFPEAKLYNYRMKWVPRRDSLYMYNLADPFQFYDGTASLDGAAIISNNGVYGSGMLITRGSTAESDKLDFKHNSYSARNAVFKVQSNDPNKPALEGDNVRLNFNLEGNFANISPEVEGQAAVGFAYAQFRTSIPDARWDLNEQKIYMTKPVDVPIENSYFYTTRKDLDSLRFNATSAVYDIETLELKVSGIPYIIVADSRITPENNEVLILENSRIGTLNNTVIVMDTLNAYHRFYDGVINVISRNEFTGHATYELVNAEGDTFAIKMTDFRLEDFTVGEGRRATTLKHTVANGTISAKDNILFSPGFFFKGEVKLEAHNPMLEMDGYLKLNMKKNNDTWIHYNHEANQEKISILFDEAVSEEGRKIHAGLYFNRDDFHLYPVFIDVPTNGDDEVFFRPSGLLMYDEQEKHFVIEDPGKAGGENFSGKSYVYNEHTSALTFEGPIQFFEGNKKANIDASVLGNGFVYEDSVYLDINTFMTIDFEAHPSLWNIMAYDLQDVIKDLGAPEGLGDPTELLYKVAEIMGEENTKNWEQATLQEYVSLGGYSKQTTKPLVFADVNLSWSAEHNSFFSNGLLGMSNIQTYDVNAAWEGFMEIGKTEDGNPLFNLFFKASSESWYYLNYQDNRLMMFSSNEEFNQTLSKRTNAAKAKAGDLVYLPGSRDEVQSFVDRFRSMYYGLTDSYQLDASASLEESNKEKKSEETIDDDGF